MAARKDSLFPAGARMEGRFNFEGLLFIDAVWKVKGEKLKVRGKKLKEKR